MDINLRFLRFLLFKSGLCRAENPAFLWVVRAFALKREPKPDAEGGKIADEAKNEEFNMKDLSREKANSPSILRSCAAAEDGRPLSPALRRRGRKTTAVSLFGCATKGFRRCLHLSRQTIYL